MPTLLGSGEGRAGGEAIDASTRPIHLGIGNGTLEGQCGQSGETRPVGGRSFDAAFGGGPDGSRTRP